MRAARGGAPRLRLWRVIAFIVASAVLGVLNLWPPPQASSEHVTIVAVGEASAVAAAPAPVAAAAAAIPSPAPRAVELPAPAACVSTPVNATACFDAAVGRLPAAPHTVVLTFGTVAVEDFLVNWVLHVQRVPALSPFLVAALDARILDVCLSRRWPAFLAPRAHIIADTSYTAEKQHKRADEYFRQDLSAFKKMGYVKALTLAALLERGYSVLVSDVDVVWLRHPWGVLGAPGKREHAPSAADGPNGGGTREQLEDADLLMGTDNVDVSLDRESHRLLETELNTGILFVRASRATVGFAREWGLRCLHTRDGHDQQEFNLLLHGCYPPEREPGAEGSRDPAERKECSRTPYTPVRVPARAADAADAAAPPGAWALSTGGEMAPFLRRAAYEAMSASGRRAVAWLWHHRLRAAVLPMAVFTGGHVYFVQRLHERTAAAAQPAAVHLSWGFGDLFGKRERLREEGWWLSEQQQGGAHAAGDFVRITGIDEVYDAAVEPWRAAAAVCRAGDPEPDRCWHPANLVEHAVAVGARDPRRATDPAAPQLAAQGALRRVLRNALALAGATNRTLVLPELRCYCERFWWLLEDCRVAGAQTMPIPFRCPFDFLFEPWAWDELGVRRRHHSLWRHAPELLRSEAVLLAAGGAGASTAEAEALRAARADAQRRGAPLALVPRGASAERAARAVEEAGGARARVLSVSARHLSELGDCSDQADSRALRDFNDRIYRLLGGHFVEYCSRERNHFLALEAPYYTSRKRDAKEAMNCSYPGAEPVVANPITWPRIVTADNRKRWYGGDLKHCT